LGQKVHPTGFRLGINKTWDSKWYAKKNFAKFLHEDLQIRKFVRSRLERAGVSKIEIERASDNLRVNIYSSRPGIVIGKRGSEIDRLKDELKKIISKNVTINTFEIKKAEIDSQLVAENVALQLERRIAFRRAMKKNVASALRFGAQGIKIRCSGRLGGAEIARTEWFREGRVPLHTLRADVDYGFAEARTTYGIIGVKVWIYKGEILPERVKVEDKAS